MPILGALAAEIVGASILSHVPKLPARLVSFQEVAGASDQPGEQAQGNPNWIKEVFDPNYKSPETDAVDEAQKKDEFELEAVKAAQAEEQQEAIQTTLKDKALENQSVGDGKLTSAARHARDLAKLARLWGDHAAALVDAVRLEALDLETSRVSSDAAKVAHEVPEAIQLANSYLRALPKARRGLQEIEDQEAGRVPGLPVGSVVDDQGSRREVALKRISSATRKAMDALDEAARVMDRYQELAKAAETQSKLAPPVIRDADVHLTPITEAEGLKVDEEPNEGDEEEGPVTTWAEGLKDMDVFDQGEPFGRTSSGCTCDDQAKCSRQGRSFTWCRVGAAERCVLLRRDNAKMLDPGGSDHILYHQRHKWDAADKDLERIDSAWDYCTPKPGPRQGAAPPTAHGGICQWRGDLLFRYGEDPKFRQKNGVLNKFGMPAMNLDAVPLKDRLALEVMIQYRQDPQNRSLCAETEGSRPFAVCPAIPNPKHPELGSRGWLATRSWDYCDQRKWRPPTVAGGASPGGGGGRGEGGELAAEPGPKAPPLPRRVAGVKLEEAKAEEQVMKRTQYDAVEAAMEAEREENLQKEQEAAQEQEAAEEEAAQTEQQGAAAQTEQQGAAPKQEQNWTKNLFGSGANQNGTAPAATGGRARPPAEAAMPLPPDMFASCFVMSASPCEMPGTSKRAWFQEHKVRTAKPRIHVYARTTAFSEFLVL